MLNEIYEYIEQRRDDYLGWLTEFCKIPSVAAQNRGMKESVQYLGNLFESAFEQSPEVLDTGGYPVVFSHLKGDADTILSFYNHYDVQPEEPIELWKTPPFEPTIVDDKIYARGIADNKGNLIARMAAVHAIKEVAGRLPIDIKFIFEGEEEIGSINLGAFAEKNQGKIQSDGCVWEFGYRDADERLQVSLGVKGMLYVELFTKGAKTDLHSAQASIVESPVWRLVWALNLLKDKNEQVLIPGFYDDIAPLTEEDKQLIQHYRLEEDNLKKHLEIDAFVNGLTGDKLKNKHIFEPTCNICGIHGGYTGEGSKTVLPSEAFAKIDFRLVPGQSPQKILESLRSYLDDNGFDDIGIRVFGKEDAARTHPSEKIVEAAIETIESYTKQKPNTIPNTPGTGPMYELCQKFGIPSVSFGVGHFASYTHAPNENIRVEDFIDGIKMMAALVLKFGEKMQKVKESSHGDGTNE
ncbi:M20/M25/M40 family metallo-hydrolase [Cytobacillus depressus]|uniref:M20/M25/M40 family metallo-hydrolase n=1 Tax=Cytobacillus depressus TaxID=1602942 RepID=A0A6L3V8I4_9BACI|nr:M20/M25/M40 family metallo-hydrolase [Cytobacillus depressus]KAB2336731.1 M20/M25/M40 family metallo-hydrolase [Cytobacillus depressus]